MEEIWLDVVGKEGYYQVSNKGRVRSVPHVDRLGRLVGGKILSQNKKDKFGYNCVSLSVDGVIEYKRVHRLVAEAFIPNPENKPQVDHYNTDPTDNRVENLHWVDATENMNNEITKAKLSAIPRTDEWRRKTSLSKMGEKSHWYGKPKTEEWKQNMRERLSGKGHPSSRAVVEIDKDGNVIGEYGSVREAARCLNLYNENIRRVCNNIHKQHKGHIFRWKKDE